MAAMVMPTLSRLSASESESDGHRTKKQERDERKLINVWANSLEELDRMMMTRI